MVYDVSKIRRDFPILDQQMHGKPLVYLDNGATTHKPQVVIDSMVKYCAEINANIHRGAHGMGNAATTAFENVRQGIADFIGAADYHEIIFTRNATESINLVAQTWGRENLKAGDEIVLTQMEHHANVVPWQMIAKEKGVQVRFIPLTQDGRLDMEAAAKLVGPKTKLVAFSWVSNVLGTINDVDSLATLARKHGAAVAVDAAQAAPHFYLDLQNHDFDFVAFSAHKMLGPTGVGVLWGRKQLLEAMPPYQGGGSMISTVDSEGSTWNEVPWKFEAGTPDIAGVVAFGPALGYFKNIGWEALAEWEETLKEKALAGLKSIPGLKLFGPADTKDRVAVFSFNLEGINPQDIGAMMDSYGIAMRVGNHCAQPLMACYQVPGMVRASFYLYNTLEEVDAMVAGLKKAQKMLQPVVS